MHFGNILEPKLLIYFFHDMFTMARNYPMGYFRIELIYAIQRGRGEQFVSDNSKCIRTSEGESGTQNHWCFATMYTSH